MTHQRTGFEKALGSNPAHNSNQQQNLPVGGRISEYIEGWKKITSDKWVLSVIQEGLKLSFHSIPKQEGIKITKFGSLKQNEVVMNEILELLQKRAIEKVPFSQIGEGFYSTFFMVPKKDGGIRPILNLKELNTHLICPHFKMETFRSIRRAMKTGDWAFTIDLKDAYFHIPIHPVHRKFLRFVFQDTHYQFAALPFGASIAPRAFTKILGALGGYLRSQKIHIFMYLDDWLVKNQIKTTLCNQKNLILKTLDMLGLLLNEKKSTLEPTQTISYLGAVFDLRSGIIFPSEERFLNMERQLNSMIHSKECEALLFLRILGLMTSCLDLIPRARLQMRPIQFHLLSQWSANRDTLVKKIPINDELVRHLKWWLKKENFFKGIPLDRSDQLTLWTDASELGWGAHLDSLQTRGVWDPEQKKRHINWLEMKAVQLALISFLPQVEGKNVLIRTDNSTVVAYINKEGGTRSLPLCLLTWEIFSWTDKYKINLTAAHIPGKRNVIADNLSRGRENHRLTEWSLDRKIVERIFHIFDTPNIDLFATQENRQLPVYCAPWPSERALKFDALSMDWKGIFGYAFPPQILLHRVLLKVQREPCTLILIAPLTPNQIWFPILLELVIELPRLLPGIPKLLTQKKGRLIHPNPTPLKLAAWKISSVEGLTKAFLKKLKNSSQQADDLQQGRCMQPGRKSTIAGVVNEILIHALPL